MTASARLVVIGGSWGAFDPLCALLRRLPAWPVPVVVAMHRSGRSVDGALEATLRHRTGLQVDLVEDKSPLHPGAVYVAPADYHLLVDGDRLALSLDAPERYSRPSIDVLFEAAAASYGAGVVAVVLSGANDDGARGAAVVRAHGGRVLVQDPSDAERAEMPQAVLARGAFDVMGSVEELADVLADVVGCGAR